MKRHAPATERNREPILGVLREELPQTPDALVLEVASGTGEHAVHFARALPHVRWQPSDHDLLARTSIEAHRAEATLPNLLPPIALDAASGQFPVPHADAVVCINMIHIAPWRACEGLMAGSATVLSDGTPLILYGPFFREEEGVPTAPSNLSFDQSLKERNPEWGVRRLGEVTRVAEAHGLRRTRLVELPSNNCAVVVRRQTHA